MSSARQRRARLARKASRIVERAKPIRATPETVAKLRPHPMELLLALGRDDGGIDADQWQCAEEIIDARDAFSVGLGFNSNDLQSMMSLGFAASIGGHGRSPMSKRDERLATIWFAWAAQLESRWRVRRPFVVVERIESALPFDAPMARALGEALDLWARVRSDVDRAMREV